MNRTVPATTALITGIGGQDGSYLAELLMDRGYAVHGLVRRSSALNRGRIDGLRAAAAARGLPFELHYGNLIDPLGLQAVIGRVKPDEIYNLASESHVGISFDEPEHSTSVNAVGVLRLLEIMRLTRPECRFYQASTSELFGGLVLRPRGANAGQAPPEPRQSRGHSADYVCTEASPFEPISPYAIAKQYAHAMTAFYRRGYGLHATNGILFNHESPRRGFNFVTRKITATLARIARGSDEVLLLGNLDSRRDWGYAPDYVRAMWLMTTHDIADDYIIATGQTRSVRDFVERAAAVAGFEIAWEGTGPAEVGYDRMSSRRLVAVEPRFFRPLDHSSICGSAEKARAVLGWEPMVTFDRLVEIMMQAELTPA
ncbi:MAG: GDP-mannose 4,6-dehydratase [Planctomycetia bacterium]|nr:GDP-mannose 4,6-dehydratase [Planctomycetia bacterium]